MLAVVGLDYEQAFYWEIGRRRRSLRSDREGSGGETGGGEEGREAFSPLSNMLSWGPVHRLQFPSLVSTIMKVEFKQDSRISIQCRICVI